MRKLSRPGCCCRGECTRVRLLSPDEWGADKDDSAAASSQAAFSKVGAPDAIQVSNWPEVASIVVVSRWGCWRSGGECPGWDAELGACCKACANYVFFASMTRCSLGSAESDTTTPYSMVCRQKNMSGPTWSFVFIYLPLYTTEQQIGPLYARMHEWMVRVWRKHRCMAGWWLVPEAWGACVYVAVWF